MPRIIIARPSGANRLEVEQATFDEGFYPGFVYVADASGSPSSEPSVLDGAVASLVPSASASATSTALRAAFGRIVTAQSFGVVGDGTTNDAVALNQAATFAATYGLRLLLGDQMTIKLGSAAFAPPSGSRIDGNGATLVNARAGTNDVAVDITGKTGISMWNLTVDGNKAGFAGATEYRHNVNIIDSSQILLRDITSKNAKGEGIYIGRATGHSSGVRGYNLRCTGNYRNGLGVIDLADGKFFGCDFSSSVGTFPQAGVDVEPNDTTCVVNDVTFLDCTATGNSGPGILITVKPGGSHKRISWIGGVISGNGQQGVYLYHAQAVHLTNVDIISNGNQGVGLLFGNLADISIIGCRIALNGNEGVSCSPNTGDGTTAPTVKNLRIMGCDILDNGAATPGTTYAGIVLDTIGPVAGTVDGVTIQGCTVSNRDTTNQWIGLVTTADARNVTLTGNDLRSNAVTSLSLADDPATRQRWNNRGADELQTVTTSTTVDGTRSFIAANPPGSTPITITLPAVGENNKIYTIYDAAGLAGSGSPITIALTSGAWANVATSLTIPTNGGSVQVYYRSSKWWLLSQTPVPMLTSAVQPSENKYLGWNFDLADAGGSVQPLTSGTLFVQRAYVPQGGAISNVSMYIGTAAAGAVSGQCFAAVFSQSGALLGVTNDVSTLLGSTGMKDLPLAAPTTALSPGATVLVALLMNATTPPSIARKPSGLNGGPNINIASASLFRWATAGTGLTAMPGSLTPSGFTSQTSAFWVALK